MTVLENASYVELSRPEVDGRLACSFCDRTPPTRTTSSPEVREATFSDLCMQSYKIVTVHHYLDVFHTLTYHKSIV